MLWGLEQAVLTDVLSTYFAGNRPRHLDFACGTGRVLSFLEPRCASSTGVDISDSMLSVSRRNSPGAEVIHGDLTRQPLLPGRKFNLITAFRFFPNAEPPLRDDALAALVPLLAEDGVLVVNNHLNSSSLSRTILTRLGRRPGHSMTRHEMEVLLTSHGLFVRRVRGLGLLPLADRHVRIAPRLVQQTERAVGRVGGFTDLAQDQIFIATISRPNEHLG